MPDQLFNYMEVIEFLDSELTLSSNGTRNHRKLPLKDNEVSLVSIKWKETHNSSTLPFLEGFHCSIGILGTNGTIGTNCPIGFNFLTVPLVLTVLVQVFPMAPSKPTQIDTIGPKYATVIWVSFGLY